ncbi:PREDICTED: cystathionine gamma-synthase 1, chloroplastic-like isoform X2 [Camelina sativa]|uniref:Cystathionine gamma-synthase 1, chloroplastic-like isoform X2 n=1 Tax=Camelina sativa TaxID=90675 RepID=A0ABM0X0C0_CAMSA|nr:PREDICTED: cystathionine gamma-synthase 1, chloroplastic-like isoform X2 [Camelina sativa]
MGEMNNLKPSFLSSDGSLAVHAGERLCREINTTSITTPVVNTTTYFFKNTSELVDFKEQRIVCHEYTRYGSPTTMVLEEKISALEGAESTLVVASGMCAISVMLLALVPTNGHIVTTTDCYKETRMIMETFLPKLGITVTFIDSADTAKLEAVVNEHNVSMFFTESPTNPFLRCVDIKLVSEICHKRGTLVCIDGTIATPLNQKALALGADLILQSGTKYIGGHNDVLAGCISGSTKLISKIRILHQLLGGTLNPNAAYLLIRSMKTMHLRVKQHNSNALRMAQVLEAHPKIAFSSGSSYLLKNGFTVIVLGKSRLLPGPSESSRTSHSQATNDWFWGSGHIRGCWRSQEDNQVHRFSEDPIHCNIFWWMRELRGPTCHKELGCTTRRKAQI